jgi:hypothetical protein
MTILNPNLHPNIQREEVSDKDSISNQWGNDEMMECSINGIGKSKKVYKNKNFSYY